MPGSPAAFLISSARTAATQSMTCWASLPAGAGIGLGGISWLVRRSASRAQRAKSSVDHIHAGVGLEIELGGGHLAAMAGHAIFADKGPDRLLKLLVDWGRGGSGCIPHGGCGEREGEEKGPKLH